MEFNTLYNNHVLPIMIPNPSKGANIISRFKHPIIFAPDRQSLKYKKGRRSELVNLFSHASKNYTMLYFVTLTYDDEHLPMSYDVNFLNYLKSRSTCAKFADTFEGMNLPIIYLPHIQSFIKNMRKSLSFDVMWQSDYGYTKTHNYRPHFHCIFLLKDKIGLSHFVKILQKWWNKSKYLKDTLNHRPKYADKNHTYDYYDNVIPCQPNEPHIVKYLSRHLVKIYPKDMPQILFACPATRPQFRRPKCFGYQYYINNIQNFIDNGGFIQHQNYTENLPLYLRKKFNIRREWYDITDVLTSEQMSLLMSPSSFYQKLQNADAKLRFFGFQPLQYSKHDE